MPDSEGSGYTGHLLEGSLAVVIIIVFLGIILYGFSQPFNPTFLNLEYIFGGILTLVQAIIAFFEHVGPVAIFLVLCICVLLIGFIFYLILRLFEMDHEHTSHVYHYAVDNGPGPESVVEESGGLFIPEDSDISSDTDKTKPGAEKWEIVLDHISSSNSSDWRLAIIEADTILDEMVETQGFEGANLGERLKNAGVGAFNTIDDAWEAHKVRNRIAHEGASFELTHREAQQTVARYENVFREFDYI